MKCDAEDVLLVHLCAHACGTADAPTLAFVAELDQDEVLAAMERLLATGHVEAVGVSFRVTDAGLARVNGGRS